MNEVPEPINPPSRPEDDDSAHQFRPVSAVGVELDASSQTVVMKLQNPGNDKDFVFVFSPAAAERLSRHLHETVQDYLYGVRNQL